MSTPHTASEARIGALDSGVGGLSVLQEIHRLLPAYPTLYFADQSHLPYGTRTADEIRTFTTAITRFLLGRGAVVIVLACNAASAASLYHLRRRFPTVPFVGMEPAVKPAAQATRSGVIGVLTTHATAAGPLYRRVIDRYADGVRVVTQIAPELVDIVESGHLHTPDSRRTIHRHIRPLLDAGADHIALACTHFPFLRQTIQQVTGPDVTLIDPGEAIARRVADVWPDNVEPARAENEYFTSGSPDHLRASLESLTGINAPVTAVRP